MHASISVTSIADQAMPQDTAAESRNFDEECS